MLMLKMDSSRRVKEILRRKQTDILVINIISHNNQVNMVRNKLIRQRDKKNSI